MTERDGEQTRRVGALLRFLKGAGTGQAPRPRSAPRPSARSATIASARCDPALAPSHAARPGSRSPLPPSKCGRYDDVDAEEEGDDPWRAKTAPEEPSRALKQRKAAFRIT